MRRWFQSMGCALAGLAYMLRSQPNARIHAAASVAVIVLAVFLRLGRGDWCLLVPAIAMVWCAEAMNTALECLADRITKEHNSLIGHAKDAGAAAVLCAAVGAAVIGLLVLGPPLWAVLAK